MRSRILAWQIALAMAVVAAWQAGAAFKLLDPFFFSRPSDIGRRIGTWLVDGTLITGRRVS